MKRTKAAVPATETGKIPGDYSGSRPFMTMPEKGGHNRTMNEGRRGAGQVAPRPQNSKSQLMGASAHTAGVQAGLARVKAGGSAPPEGRFMPVQKPPAGLSGSTIGQPDPHGFNPGGPGINIGRPATKTPTTQHPTATRKPKTRAALAFYGE